ncbi:patatin [Rhodococcus sp. AD45-ID]|uniref:patatin-like phospholipase family protein n=1 Tax=unclassified Rhodococcus (in: high G+C Gram-positive bacteria) TaxID=192944 RepID=UPI0005D34978|nr:MULTISPECIES: patatin-like phospholipase family protein [unclassified Rhodococcus (in: high G+C Gram-positive bacteria)]PSR42809.1 patatin [Rhodococcus sp. AD45-ID]
MDGVKLGLVLAGGGVAGIAWETGFLLGVQDNSADAAAALLAADVLIGTSAGSTVTAQIAGGATLQELFDAQTAEPTGEIDPKVDVEVLGQMFVDAIAGSEDRPEQLRLLGEAAMSAGTVEPSLRRAVIEARLRNRAWPDRELRIPAINAETGELTVFGKAAGVDLIDAVGASCAVPGVWPTVTIDGRRYMDGGMASGSNVHLAADCDVVVVLSPAADPAPNLLGGSLREEIDAMTQSRVLPIFADDAVVEAIGTNSLSPATRRPAAELGREQGRRTADEIAAFLVTT